MAEPYERAPELPGSHVPESDEQQIDGPPGNRLGIAFAALVCGLLALIGFWSWAVLALGPMAIVLGAVHISAARETGQWSRMAVAGVALGVVSLALFGLASVVLAGQN